MPTPSPRKIENPQLSLVDTRMFRVLLFLIITWTIAGSFILLNNLLLEIFTGAVNRELLSPEITTPSPVRADCRAAIEQALSSVPDPATIRQDGLAVWQLGFQVGFATGMRNTSAQGNQNLDVNKLIENIRPLAETLGIKKPSFPTLVHQANALHEFVVFVEQDPDCVGAQLGSRFSPRHRGLYQFALAIGHAAVYRMMAPQLGAMFIPQIRRYGQLAGIPRELSEPLIAQSMDGMSQDEAKRRVMALLADIEQYVQSHP